MTTITIINPWTQAAVRKDIAGLTQAELDAYAQIMNDESREAINDRLGYTDCTPEQWLAAWVELVGAEKAGVVILGS